MSSTKTIIEQVRELLEKEIAELEQKLQLYQLLLSILDACHEKQEGGLEILSEIKAGQQVYARIAKAKDTLILDLAIPAPPSNPYVKYLVKSLEQLKEVGGIDYSVDESPEGIKKVKVRNLDEETLEEAKTIFEFVAKKLASSYQSAKRKSRRTPIE